MKLTAHNLTNASGTETIRFVVWSRQGTGMVNVFSDGASGQIMSIEGARKYWKDAVNKWGYKPAAATTIEPY